MHFGRAAAHRGFRALRLYGLWFLLPCTCTLAPTGFGVDALTTRTRGLGFLGFSCFLCQGYRVYPGPWSASRLLVHALEFGCFFRCRKPGSTRRSHRKGSAATLPSLVSEDDIKGTIYTFPEGLLETEGQRV